MVSKRKAKGSDRGKGKKVKSVDQASPPSPAAAPRRLDDGNALPSVEAPPALGAGADALTMPRRPSLTTGYRHLGTLIDPLRWFKSMKTQEQTVFAGSR